MLTDLDVDHGVDHVNHMGTEAWRCATVTRIEQLLDQGEPLNYRGIPFFPTFEALVLAFPPTIDGAQPVEGVS